MSFKSIILGSGACLAILQPAGAFAQTAPAGDAPSGAGEARDSAVGDIIVNARRREETLVNIPVAATVLNSEALRKYNTTDLASIGELVPGVDLKRGGGGGNGAFLSIRNVGPAGLDYGGEQPVAVAIDGVSITRGHITDLGFFDMESFQVLKGPQALFFGKNSPAGVVAIDTAGPGDRLEGYARLGYVFDPRSIKFEGAISSPLTETLGVRVAVQVNHPFEGYIRNTAYGYSLPSPIAGGDAAACDAAGRPALDCVLPGASEKSFGRMRYYNGRVTLKWTPGTDFDATLKLTGGLHRDNNPQGPIVIINCAPGQTQPISNGTLTEPDGTCGRTRSNSIGNASPFILSHYLYAPADGKPYSRTDQFLASLTTNYRFGDMTLTTVSGYYHSFQRAYGTYDNSFYAQSLAFQRETNDSYTQEVRLASDFQSPVNFTLGAYYQHDNRDLLVSTHLFQPLGGYVPYPGTDGISNTNITTADNRSDSFSVFGQLSWKILDNLELAGGARFTHDSRRTTLVNLENYLQQALGFPAETGPFQPVDVPIVSNTKSTNVSPEVTLTWHPIPDTTLYGAFKTGYLAGGTSNPGILSNYTGEQYQPNPERFVQYKNQTVKGFEIGAKASLLGGRLYGDLTYFRYVYKNLQVQVLDLDTLSFNIDNAEGALSRGFEALVNFQATDQLNLHGSVSYSKLNYKGYRGAPCYPGQTMALGCVDGAQDLSGTAYGGPPWGANAGFRFDQPLSESWSGELNFDAFYHGHSPRRLRQPNTDMGSYTQLNASIRLYQPDGPFEVALLGTNLTNEYVFYSPSGRLNGLTGETIAGVMPGRQVTLQVAVKF